MMSLDNVNAMSVAEFVAAFGEVAEHSPWVAEAAASARPFTSRDAMVAAFTTAMQSAGDQAKLDLIRAHPDLAGKAMLTDDSSREQAGAGFDTLSEDEFTRFTELNDAYKAKFEFPFIFAVKGADKHQILAAFGQRLENTRDQEFDTACSQVCRIFMFRIEDRVMP